MAGGHLNTDTHFRCANSVHTRATPPSHECTSDHWYAASNSSMALELTIYTFTIASSYLLWRASGQLGIRRLSSANRAAEGDDERRVAGIGREPTATYATPAALGRRTGTAAAATTLFLLWRQTDTRHMMMSTSSRWYRAGGARAGFLLVLRLHGPFAVCIDVCSPQAGDWGERESYGEGKDRVLCLTRMRFLVRSVSVTTTSSSSSRLASIRVSAPKQITRVRSGNQGALPLSNARQIENNY